MDLGDVEDEVTLAIQTLEAFRARVRRLDAALEADWRESPEGLAAFPPRQHDSD